MRAAIMAWYSRHRSVAAGRVEVLLGLHLGTQIGLALGQLILLGAALLGKLLRLASASALAAAAAACLGLGLGLLPGLLFRVRLGFGRRLGFCRCVRGRLAVGLLLALLIRLLLLLGLLGFAPPCAPRRAAAPARSGVGAGGGGAGGAGGAGADDGCPWTTVASMASACGCGLGVLCSNQPHSSAATMAACISSASRIELS